MSTSIFVARITPPSPGVPFTSTIAPTTSGPSSWSMIVASVDFTDLPPIVQSPTKPDAGIAVTVPLSSSGLVPGGGGAGGSPLGGGVPSDAWTSIFVASSTPPSPIVPFASTVAPITSAPSLWSMTVSAVLRTALPPIVQSPTKPLAGMVVTVPLTSTRPSFAAANGANRHAARAMTASAACFGVIRMWVSQGGAAGERQTRSTRSAGLLRGKQRPRAKYSHSTYDNVKSAADGRRSVPRRARSPSDARDRRKIRPPTERVSTSFVLRAEQWDNDDDATGVRPRRDPPQRRAPAVTLV